MCAAGWAVHFSGYHIGHIGRTGYDRIVAWRGDHDTVPGHAERIDRVAARLLGLGPHDELFGASNEIARLALKWIANETCAPADAYRLAIKRFDSRGIPIEQ